MRQRGEEPRVIRNEMVSLNGVEQFIAIRADRPNLPLLLYLHGGPGDAALPLVLKYNRALEQDFTLVVWEQRGAGKSYYPFGAEEKVEIDTFLQDVRALVELLLARFQREKLFLVGHSWGSVLGLLFCQQFPQFVHTYVGCGQVVNLKKSSELAYRFAVEHAVGRAAKRLVRIDCAYRGETWLSDLLFVTKQVVKHKGSLYGASNYHQFVLDFLFSKEYGWKDLFNREKGALQSIRRLWPELMEVSFEGTTSFAVPIVLIEGTYDFHVSSQLAKEYFDTITSEKAFYFFEHSCHFPQWSEADRFHSILKKLGGNGETV